MGKGTLTIYNASAGSGKTYTLSAVYLKYLFKSRFNYRRILAVTFTNKATAEMKSRILENLYKLGSGGKSDYLDDLIISTGRPEEWIRREAKEILNSILHDYSRFSVSTIDSFFQKILRAFAREAGLHAGFSIEMDHSIILSDAVDEMMRSAGTDPQLKQWLTSYALSNIEEEKTWNLKEGIISLSQELFKEKFKVLSSDQRSLLANKEFLMKYISELRVLTKSFENRLRKFGTDAAKFFDDYQLDDSMFFQKGKGVPGFVRSMISGEIKKPNSYVLEITNANPKWSTGPTDPSLQAAVNAGLDKLLLEAIEFFNRNITVFKTAEAILANIYSLGILSDVLYNVHQVTTSENSFLLSDAGEVLNLITGGDQTSFIYEKTGNSFDNFMIDEFQDTSEIQWNNFKPLIDNSMAEGSDSLVVGDVKQSIYRWRNSDWKILGSVLKKRVDNDRIISRPLTTNWRSCPEIIRFNNRLFTVIPEQIDELFSSGNLPLTFKELYSEAVQQETGKQKGGFVHLEFVENSVEAGWQTNVLQKLPGVIAGFLKKGYRPSDIGIIIRDGREGSMVLKTLIDYNNLPNEEKEYDELKVVSNDSLLLTNAPVLNFITSVLSVVNDPSDMISRAMMLRFYLLSSGDDRADKVSLESSDMDVESQKYFPDGYEDLLGKLRHLPLFEATEAVIKFFGLGIHSCNLPYLNTFQDHVLSYSASRGNNIASFLEWWETTGRFKSVVMPDNQDAVRILTIHKSKGLEFRVVILPFISWNLDHMPGKQNILWVRPLEKPFDKLGIVPVKYSKDLLDTYFAGDYSSEKYSVYIDNINLLYVAFTRAREALYGFSVNNPRSENTVAGVLKNALIRMSSESPEQDGEFSKYFNSQTGIFELGEITPEINETEKNQGRIITQYHVSRETESLRLKLHGENYFAVDAENWRERINYGKLMHEVFEGINTLSDIHSSVRRLVIEGKIAEKESSAIENRIKELIRNPVVSDWFRDDNVVLKEAGILLPSGTVRRPDRVIIRGSEAIIVDFKFGEQNPGYSKQINQYRNLLTEMGYSNIKAFIWYVDSNIISSVE